ncbi:UDP-glycosyltransferase UGT5-like isoform X1 [Lutzomyia longipalpis]|uniref:UDP-glycosyltransferase UGT5-like isoform X1 n=2 Tax=Lutzomyia longipalpis TaxID=7200 RepID=UPI002483D969|nr:UDP-glycosyltransferase UGT5-like isoform X1 [Lutzomyia longipalpis]
MKKFASHPNFSRSNIHASLSGHQFNIIFQRENYSEFIFIKINGKFLIKKMKFVIFLCFLPYFVRAANILVLENIASPSHHIWMKTLLMALVERGHNITSLSPDYEKEKIPNLHYIHLEKVYDALYDANSEDHTEDLDFLDMGTKNPYLMYNVFMVYSNLFFQGCASSQGYRQLLNYPKDFKFDLIIYDFLVGPIFLNFAEQFGNPPIIGATGFYSTSFSGHIIGDILAPSSVPAPMYTTDLSSFWDRVNNYVLTTFYQLVREYYISSKVNKIHKDIFPNGADVRELEQKMKLILLNKHPALDFIEPILPNVISVGGLQIQRNKGLPKDLQELLDTAENGVILFSLGTNVKSSMLGVERQIEILETFRSLPQYTFLWKIEVESMPVEVPKNVLIRKFVPQSDLLAHPNLKLFISHCGLLSTQEAAWFGVPILGLPVFADQFDNVRMSIRAGMAEQGSIVNIERNSFKKLILKMINDPKYRENAKARSEAFRDQKETPLERAVWWTEFVLRHPNMTYMKSPSVNLSFPVKQSWDVLAFLFSLALISIFMFMKLTCFIILRLYRRQSKKSKKD